MASPHDTKKRMLKREDQNRTLIFNNFLKKHREILDDKQSTKTRDSR